MVKLQPIDANGKDAGEPKSVTNLHYENMVRIFGTKLRYRMLEDHKSTKSKEKGKRKNK